MPSKSRQAKTVSHPDEVIVTEGAIVLKFTLKGHSVGLERSEQADNGASTKFVSLFASLQALRDYLVADHIDLDWPHLYARAIEAASKLFDKATSNESTFRTGA